MTQCHVMCFQTNHEAHLSTGEQRRVLLAQAFCQNTPLLFFDEPTASLDPSHGITLLGLQSKTKFAQKTVLH